MNHASRIPQAKGVLPAAIARIPLAAIPRHPHPTGFSLASRSTTTQDSFIRADAATNASPI
jgi:hypothetical protein